MVEVKTRKAVFLREAVRTLGLRDAEVETSRFEELLPRAGLHEALDLVSIRAVRIETANAHHPPGVPASRRKALLFAAPARATSKIRRRRRSRGWRPIRSSIPSTAKLVVLSKTTRLSLFHVEQWL